MRESSELVDIGIGVPPTYIDQENTSVSIETIQQR